MTEANQPPSHRGPVFDAAVERVKRRAQPKGEDPDYDLVRENFDDAHFLMQARHLAEEISRDPVKAFFRSGVDKNRNPHINFSVKKYLERYPEKAHLPARELYLDWLKRGEKQGRIADPAHGTEKIAPILGMGEKQLVAQLQEIRLDLQERLAHGKLGEVFAKAVEIEPLIGGAFMKTTEPKIMPVGKPIATDQVSALYRCHDLAEFRRARVLLLVNRPRWGGGRRIEGHIAHALAEGMDPDEIVVIYTDATGDTPRGRFPADVREIDFFSIARDEGMTPDDRQRVLVELIRSFHADSVVSINSKMFYEAMRTYGRALHATEQLYLVLLCNDEAPLGNWDGWPLRAFYRYFDLLTGVITDSDYLRDWLVEHHQMFDEEAARIHVFSAPVDPTLPIADRSAAAPPAGRPQVFWAGRWDRQKRIDVMLEIARRMPEVDFRMWCDHADANREFSGEPPANVVLNDPYRHISELPLSEADVWLYTSGWDGVPSQLLEVAMTEVPLVGTLVGGTGEVLTKQEAWPVPGDDPQAYVEALCEALGDLDEARRRSAALRERLLRERTVAAYAEQSSALLLRKERRA